MSVARVEILYTDEPRFSILIRERILEIEKEVSRLLNLGSAEASICSRVIVLPMPLHPATRKYALNCGNIEIFITIGYCHCGEKIFIDSFAKAINTFFPFSVEITVYRNGNCWTATTDSAAK